MVHRIFIAALALCAPLSECVADRYSPGRGSAWTEGPADGLAYASDVAPQRNPIAGVSYECDDVVDCCDIGCGDALGGCGETIPGFGRYCGCKKGEHDSCVDWILPRSNLPLPLMKQLAEDRDMTLPLPLGTSFIWTEMNRNVAIADVRLSFGSNPPTSADRVSVPETKMHASAKIARVDLWVLPCLNIYGLVGHTRVTGDIAVTVDRFPLPASPPVTINAPIDIEGPTAGWGATTGIGGKDWFAMLDVNQTWTDFDALDSELTALVVTPRVGLVIDRPWFQGEVHVGAMWQDTAQTVELTINHPILGNGLNVEVDQFEPRPWNFLVGGLWALDERVQVLVEGGMGGRSYILSGITVRY